MSDRPSEIATVVSYHERTEHRLPDRFAASLGYLDWETQPDPFRRYEGAERIELPLCEPSHDNEPSWAVTRSNAPIPPAALDVRAFSQLFYDSLAISAWKQAGPSQWALRCNPSSGNLHPTEAYALVGPVAGLTARPALLHYAPSDHAVEVRRWIAPPVFEDWCRQLPTGTFVLGLSSVVWREAWKYGERAFRYCMHDVGHAVQSITIAARMLGWRVRRIEGLAADQLDRLLALDGSAGPEAERADVLLAIESAPAATDDGPVRLTLRDQALADLCPPASGTASSLSAEHEDWPVLAAVERATRDTGSPHGDVDDGRCGRAGYPLGSSPSARVLARRRRSAVDFDGSSRMRCEQLYRMLGALVPALTPSLWTAFPHRPRVHPVVFLHRIDGLEPGLAILVRNHADEPTLRAMIARAGQWETLPGCPEELPFYRLLTDDARGIARAAHCHQDIAAQGALVTSMIASFDDELARFGAPAWRYLHWEAGAIGQLLYLEAEALALSATGIGCFFDHAIHEILGLAGGRFRMLYGTAIGRAILDPRIQTLPAYRRRA
jgi:SagB-type dehydrogenase family enzyme